MGLLTLADGSTPHLSIAVGSILIVASLLVYLFRQPSLPGNAPQVTADTWPIFGSMSFWTRRCDFFMEAVRRSKTGNFAFYVGQKPVIGITERDRQTFFEHKGLGFEAGYSALLAGAPEVKPDGNPLADTNSSTTPEGSSYVHKRLTAMLKGPQLRRGLPTLLSDVRANLDTLGSSGITDPFKSIYRMVFHLTMRTVACNELADDQEKLSRCLALYETVESAADRWMIMFPWLPLLSKARRLYAGIQLYRIFRGVVDDREKHGRRDDDALQFLIDQGDSVTDILTMVISSLFAGQLNSGIFAAYILCHLGQNPYWLDRVREEVNGVADRYCADKSLPLKERLMEVPIEAWEGEFPLIDYCLRDTIRLQMPGTAFRRNISGQDIPLKSGEVIPSGAYVALAVTQIHHNPESYTNVLDWDPGRYLPGRAEDKKEPYAFMGWGYGRHACLGMRFAKLENNLIVAMFLAYFDNFHVSDDKGNAVRLPPPNDNHLTPHRPEGPAYLSYKAGP